MNVHYLGRAKQPFLCDVRVLQHLQCGVCPYTLRTCSVLKETAGRKARGYVVESANEKASFPLPTLLECNQITNNRSEITTPNAARHHGHLRRIADEIQPLVPYAHILLFLGRDILRVHKVRSQIKGPHDAPFAQSWTLDALSAATCASGERTSHPTSEHSKPPFWRMDGLVSSAHAAAQHGSPDQPFFGIHLPTLSKSKGHSTLLTPLPTPTYTPRLLLTLP